MAARCPSRHAAAVLREDLDAAAGMNDCVPKPVTPDPLRSAVARWTVARRREPGGGVRR